MSSATEFGIGVDDPCIQSYGRMTPKNIKTPEPGTFSIVVLLPRSPSSELVPVGRS